jgi:peroxiredoxin
VDAAAGRARRGDVPTNPIVSAETIVHIHRGDAMLNPGDTAPDFTGQDHTGKTVKLSDFKGKNLVLWFFPKADTPG